MSIPKLLTDNPYRISIHWLSPVADCKRFGGFVMDLIADGYGHADRIQL